MTRVVTHRGAVKIFDFRRKVHAETCQARQSFVCLACEELDDQKQLPVSEYFLLFLVDTLH